MDQAYSPTTTCRTSRYCPGTKGKRETARNLLPPQIVFLVARSERPSRSALRRSLQLRPGMEPDWNRQLSTRHHDAAKTRGETSIFQFLHHAASCGSPIKQSITGAPQMHCNPGSKPAQTERYASSPSNATPL